MIEPVGLEDTLDLKFEDREQEIRFNNIVYDVLNDRWWCYEHNIDYVRPDTRKVEQMVYWELFLKKDTI